MSEQVRVLRLVEYIGDRKWVEESVRRAIHGTRTIWEGRTITAVTLAEYPEVLITAREVSDTGDRAGHHEAVYDANMGGRQKQ